MPSDIPFHFALADAFTVCDAYHCSLMTSTDPNRYYLWTGFTGNDGKAGGPVLDNAEAGYDWTTYPERLQAAGVSWKIYQDVGTGLDAKAGDPLYDNARTATDAAAGQGYFDLLAQDVRGGKLPQVFRGLALEQGRLGGLRDLRPHLRDPLPGEAFRCARAQHLAVAPWRRAVCGDLTSAFDFGLRETEVLPKQEAGRRPARALPYDLAADGRIAGGALRIGFAFLREVKGDAAKAGLEVVAEHVGNSQNLRLTLTNTGSADVTATVVDSYGCDGKAVLRVRAGKHMTHFVRAGASDGWYDATVTSDHAAAYVRRFAGHTENGRPSVSDPAIITG